MKRKYIYQKFKEVCLLVAGSLISIAFLPFENVLKERRFYLFILLLILILVGIGSLEGLRDIYSKLVLALNKKRKLVGIYTPYEIEEANSSWTNLSRKQLRNILKKHKINYGFFESDSSFKKYPIIVNPYGGVYPENNIATLESLDNIFDYVRRGGIYANIADIPFYYAYDKNLNRRIDTTPFAGPFTRTVSFLHSMLTKKLRVFVYGLTDKKYADKGVLRIISYNNSAINYYKKSITINNESFTPYLATPYGKGFFVFSTISINKKEESRLVDIFNKSLELVNL
jgi:hypothetical protein